MAHKAIVKTDEAIAKMRHAGKLLSNIFTYLPDIIKVGVSALQVDSFIEEKLQAAGLQAGCKGYYGYPAVSCISVNDTVVHGVPTSEIIFKDGDYVKVDVVAFYKGYGADMARGYHVGTPSVIAVKLHEVALAALREGCKKAVAGNHVSDISHAVQTYVERHGFSIVKEFAGHGIGSSMHEPPQIPNYGLPGRGTILKKGMVLCIEPMIMERPSRVVIDDKDGWTAKTAKGCWAAHVEDTVLITDAECEILTHCEDRN